MNPNTSTNPPSGRTSVAGGADLVSMLRHSLDSILVVDTAGRIHASNDTACRFTGYAAEELADLNLSCLNGGDPLKTETLFAGVRESGAARCDCVLRTKSGELRDVEASACSFPGDAACIVLFIRDVTHRVRQQAALLESQADLQQANAQLAAAAERSQELAHAAESASRAKGAFLSSITHELRTPLNVINGLAATMLEQSANQGEVHSAQLILESGQNLLGIIEVLLDFSALQAGRAKVEPRAFDLLGLITQVTRQAGLMARRKGLTFTYRIQSGVPARIVGDPRRIQQVLHNLLANAANFTNAGGIHLGVSAVRRHGRWRISCSVADSGIGIDSADIPKLFQPFARAEFGQPRQHHGIGLGLNIAQSFAELMGGGIAVRSRPGRGSVFRCCFEAEESETSSALRCVSPDGIEGRRVLLACADTDTRRMLSDTIRAWGMDPVVCPGPDTPPSPEQLSKPVDLAIVDASLARNLGAMLHRLLQARPPARSAPVVWLSNPERQWPVPQSSLSLNVAFPLDLTELARAAGGLLRSVHPAAQADTPPARLGERLPLRLLVADDIPTNREMLRRLLQHLGYKCQMAVNGAEAVAAVRLQPFDLVILDVEMPVMNGLAAAREIVRLNPDASRRPKLVALTANAQSGDREKCIAAGMDDYLTKPVLPAHIEACFQRMFEVEIQNKQPVAVVSDAADMTFVDRNQLAALFPGMPGGQVAEVLEHLMASACRDLDTAWPKIGQACASRNSQLLAETAHGLKGCFNMLGWSRVASFCNEAIQKARRGEFDGWADFGPELQRLYDHSNSEMLCYIEELARGAKPSAG